MINATASSDAVSVSIRNGSFTRRSITNCHAKTRHEIQVISITLVNKVTGNVKSSNPRRNQSEFLFERSYLTSKLRDSGPDPNVRVTLLRLFHQRGQ